MLKYNTDDGEPSEVRVPSDEDATKRPIVMVRNEIHENWRPQVLLGVAIASNRPYVCRNTWDCQISYRYCRFPVKEDALNEK